MSAKHYCKTVRYLYTEADRLADLRVELSKDLPNVGPVKEFREDNERKRKQLHKHIGNTFPGCN